VKSGSNPVRVQAPAFPFRVAPGKEVVMRVDLTRVGVAVLAGAVDEVLEAWDEREGRIGPFRTATDIGRLVLCGLGYLMQIFDIRPRLGESLAIAETPLLVKSIAKPVKAAIGAPAGGVRVARTSRVRESVVVSPALTREQETVSIIRP